ncbi:hypothetical protein A2467_01770 [Candidatus Nomurabacteria bacterium RIFOXYC2_FULL_36_8]|nr:MAG: hypothetical protein UR97_C0005G0039 [Candidatus Nomurabacteria bacterium GW2011_GWE2_36_115]KKP93754.1 MAG: hypothetical protein US00_C0005G0039 [Candidatus Nomurabacteria bacterium GW2011_GWF2_36_126]KKP97177.1 MAG: hypothetical protein US04_C0001G0680 [Candidatus Nomurabacteria bacterium GW2011_GWD2_36_14]KKP99216.1 MAG: hypothetical protein US08_C0002G0039 [Candidatus Nomurabacteria bacterium GW2011_GWF2_36_19]KKQ05863.1 MAG: hypothetical protein US17_C0001G0041 [Candidatus Nomuraba
MLKKIKIPKQIAILLALAIALNIVRIFLFHTTSSLYMFWNILLAFVPFFISSVLLLYTSNGSEGQKGKDKITQPFFIVGFILWFLFLPNAPYVMTDFIHLGRMHVVPVMYDIFFFFSSAYVSLLLGLYSIQHIEKILLLRFTKRVVSIAIPVIILFASFGIYLGRFLRFNSWDLFTSHVPLLKAIWDVFTKSNDYINVYSYTILFFFFIYISYISFKSTNAK